MHETAAAAVSGFEKAQACYQAALADMSPSDADKRTQVEAEAANTKLNLGVALVQATKSGAMPQADDGSGRARALFEELIAEHSSTEDRRLKAIASAAATQLKRALGQVDKAM